MGYNYAVVPKGLSVPIEYKAWWYEVCLVSSNPIANFVLYGDWHSFQFIDRGRDV